MHPLIIAAALSAAAPALADLVLYNVRIPYNQLVSTVFLAFSSFLYLNKRHLGLVSLIKLIPKVVSVALKPDTTFATPRLKTSSPSARLPLSTVPMVRNIQTLSQTCYQLYYFRLVSLGPSRTELCRR